MSGAEWAVLVAGGLAILAVNWWFFMAEAPVARANAQTPGGAVEVNVVVRGGYAPATIRVHRGDTVRLVLDRQDESGCSEEIVFPDFGIRRFLPAYEKTTIELRPEQPGTYEFTCGMSMLHGRLIVE